MDMLQANAVDNRHGPWTGMSSAGRGSHDYSSKSSSLARTHGPREEVAEKPSIHKAYQNLLKRRHDLLVHEVKARVLELGRLDPRFQVLSVKHDQSTWTTVPDPSGLEESLSVAPDLVAVLVAGGTRTTLFIEVQGTAAPTHVTSDKAKAYLSYFETGRLMSDYACRSARVLFVTFSDDPVGDDHRNNLLETIAEVRGADRVVLVTSAPAVATYGLLAPIFLRPLEYREALAGPESSPELRRPGKP